ncbi:RNA helicase [[Brevibacterium] frigoritolerans]|nr:RNA helicase [Peribacillus frigoritolerans]
MNKLIYFLDKGNENYIPIYEYYIPSIDPNEILTRQLCTYFIKDGKQYELIANEMEGQDEILTVKPLGYNRTGVDEKKYDAFIGIPIEFRKLQNNDRHTHLAEKLFDGHWDVLRYLVKDYVEVPGYGKMEVTSTELDEDRTCYVIYVKEDQ